MMTNVQRQYWKAYCSEPIDNIENYQQALAENFEGWDIHHRREIQPDGTRISRQELKDHKLYYGLPASELVFMRHSEHIALHRTGKHRPPETRQKIAEALRGKHHSAETRKKMSEAHKGKHNSAESRKKMSEAHKGKHNSAESRLKISESLKDKTLSVHWWNNGVSNKKARECPGEGWKRGMLKVSMTSL